MESALRVFQLLEQLRYDFLIVKVVACAVDLLIILVALAGDEDDIVRLGDGERVTADTIASTTAKALAPYYEVTLIYAFEKPGVLKNPDDDSSVIGQITRADFDRYVADGTVAGGMIPKIENALGAIDAGVERVIITKADAIDGKHGTIII